VDTLTLFSSGFPRRVLLFRPPGVVDPLPIVLVLHGTGGSADFAADETGWADLAEERRFVVAFPEGLPHDPDSPPRFLSNPLRWNDGSTPPDDPLHTDTDDVAFLADVIRTQISRGVADPARVYLTGFSNGAGMAFRFAAERGDLLAAVAPVAGYCPVAVVEASAPVSTLYVVGDADLLIPYAGGPVRLPWGNRVVNRPAVPDTLAKWAGLIGCEPTPRVVSSHDGVVESVYPGLVDFRSVVVSGLGHHWPGGKGQFNPRIGGPPSNRLNANERLWAFFERQSRSSDDAPLHGCPVG
jgi:polyhydroxybutyrate depolymerase